MNKKMMKKSLFLTVLVASLMLVSTLSLSSCKKEAPVGETVALRSIDHQCRICYRELTPAPEGTPLPPPLVNTDFSCYHEYQVDEPCGLAGCNYFPRHHYHFFFIPSNHNYMYQIDYHIGGGTD